MNPYSRFLFAEPSFLEGVARVLDLGNTLNVYNGNVSAADADSAALRADWYAVGDALVEAATVVHTERMQKGMTGRVETK